MNKDSVLKLLIAVFSNIDYHLDLPHELIDIITGSGYESKFFTLLVARLHQLSAYGLQATTLQEFENLGGGLFSMHLSGKGFNIRILYGFMPNGAPALLRAFHERGGKKKTDYSSQIPLGVTRLNELRKEFEYEK